MRGFLAVLSCTAVLAACSDDPDPSEVRDSGGDFPDAVVRQDAGMDAEDDASTPVDAGGGDAGLSDIGRPDLGAIDGGDYGETRVPLTDMGAATYKGMFVGGLYGRGENSIPEPHLTEGLMRARGVQPLDAAGVPSGMGKYVMISVGMSNTTMEFCNGPNGMPPCSGISFMGRAEDDNDINHTTLSIVNGALGSRIAASWDSAMDPDYDRVRDTVLQPRGLTEAQVVVAWVKVANPDPSDALPAQNADAYELLERLGNIMRSMKTRFPNLSMVFLSSRIYAGYATTGLNPEPYAYESGFAVKMLIEAQRAQMESGQIVDARAGDLDYRTVAPWLAWSAYLWADGTNARSDGLRWEQSDLAADGTHPGPEGQEKVGNLLINFFKGSPVTKCWFLANGQCP
jgi:hypothetical protein